jgi:DNA-binding response OmpR family regulator
MEENKQMKSILFLLNDNDPVLLSVIRNKFKKEAGWESIITQSYDIALEAFDSAKPNGVMTEIILNDETGKTGFDLISEIRGREAGENSIPIIVFSDLEQDEDIKKAKELGATEYYIKTNTTLNELIADIQRIVDAHQ